MINSLNFVYNYFESFVSFLNTLSHVFDISCVFLLIVIFSISHSLDKLYKEVYVLEFIVNLRKFNQTWLYKNIFNIIIEPFD